VLSGATGIAAAVIALMIKRQRAAEGLAAA
jgi:hypothetical protein